LDILSFFGSVWLAIITGIFIIAMIIGCTYDRRQSEAAKWWIFFLGVALYAGIGWSHGYRFSWDALWSSHLWRVIGIYLVIGFAYSILEFALDVRRSVRYWRERWALYRSNKTGKAGKDVESPADIANSFVSSMYSKSNQRIIGVAFNADAKGTDDLIVPKVDRTQLAEHISVWILFWPFYAVSLIIGDLVMEIARIAADVFAKISGRFVRMSFANVFKF